ncbi:MAG: DNA primase [Pseudanabaenaceae cyanobacterium bins.68]|nr:DNA primase [Pseudanabaenaceae cyanobacterium bins.68]
MSTPRLTPETIAAINQQIDLVEIVAEHVVLRKSGANFRGACPFHQGSNATALSVNPSKQIYHCFSCGASGNGFQFLMKIGDRSFQEVAIDLARKHHIPLQTLEPEQNQELERQLTQRQQLYEVVGLAASFFHHALFATQGKAALSYLLEQRHLTLETIKRFQLGYAPAGWDTLYGYLVNQKRYGASLVEAAGLIVPRKSGGGYYDRFRDRLIIPIMDLQGKPIAFGGRALGDEQPKYLNSPETPLFHKGTVLFGLHLAREAIAKRDRAIVVEGYFDAIALHQAGFPEAIATMGVALQGEQVRQLLRYTESKRLILNFDGDQAGKNAAERAIAGFADLIYSGTVQLRVLTLPQGKDAAEFLQHHAQADYGKLADTAPLFLDWQINLALTGKNLDQADQFHQASEAIAQLLAKLPDHTLRSHYIHQAAQLLAQGSSHLALRLEQDLRRQLHHQIRRDRWPSRPPTSPTTALQLAETQLLQIYLHFSYYRQQIYELIEQQGISFSFEHHRQLWQMILDLLDQGSTSLEPSHPDQLVPQLQLACVEITDLALQLHHLLWLDENAKIALLRPALVIRAAIARIQLIMAEKRYHHWRNLWQATDLKHDSQLGYFYQSQIQAEKQQIFALQQQLEVNFIDLAREPDDQQDLAETDLSPALADSI